MHKTPLYALLAEYDDPKAVLRAAERAYEEGYRKMEAYSPFPIEGLSEAVGFHKTRLPMMVFMGGLLGALIAYGGQYWVEAIAYPVNVGGRPFHSWPAYVPVTFEMTVLFASLTAVIGMLALNGLPRPYHPIFNAPRFALASRNRFFLAIEAIDPKFDLDATRRFLESTGPFEVTEVEP